MLFQAAQYSAYKLNSTPTFYISICISTLPTQHTTFVYNILVSVWDQEINIERGRVALPTYKHVYDE